MSRWFDEGRCRRDLLEHVAKRFASDPVLRPSLECFARGMIRPIDGIENDHFDPIDHPMRLPPCFDEIVADIQTDLRRLEYDDAKCFGQILFENAPNEHGGGYSFSWRNALTDHQRFLWERAASRVIAAARRRGL